MAMKTHVSYELLAWKIPSKAQSTTFLQRAAHLKNRPIGFVLLDPLWFDLAKNSIFSVNNVDLSGSSIRRTSVPLKMISSIRVSVSNAFCDVVKDWNLPSITIIDIFCFISLEKSCSSKTAGLKVSRYVSIQNA